jgi:hypothetical protein
MITTQTGHFETYYYTKIGDTADWKDGKRSDPKPSGIVHPERQ